MTDNKWYVKYLAAPDIKITHSAFWGTISRNKTSTKRLPNTNDRADIYNFFFASGVSNGNCEIR